MFMLRNLGKYIFGDNTKQDIIQLDAGQLYIVRPNSVKGYSECIFKDAQATIRRTSTTYHYQLVIQRAYEEGEEQLLDDAEDSDDTKDEKEFLLDETLHLRSTIRDGQAVFAWRDLSGDPGDLYEFICDTSVQPSAIQTFETVSLRCQYERKFNKSHDHATESELQQFVFTDSSIPPASPTTISPAASEFSSPISSPRPTANDEFATPPKMSSRRLRSNKNQSPEPEPEPESPQKTPVVKKTVAPKAQEAPESFETLCKEDAQLHLFDMSTQLFYMLEEEVTATVSEVGKWQYWLQIEAAGKPAVGTPVIADMNPVFNFDYKSFVFNYYDKAGSAYSYLLRFADIETEERFQEGLMRALWEQLNEIKWAKAKDQEREYVLDAFQDLTMEDAPSLEAEEEEEEEEEYYEDAEDDTAAGNQSEEYDSDEEQDDVHNNPAVDDDGNINSQLAVGFKSDRSFVVRGNQIGVFKHVSDKDLEFSTTITNVRTTAGKSFAPSKVMLHQGDSSMIMQDPNNPHSLYRMDLEYGKIVDDYKIHDDIPVKLFAPEKKFAQMTGEQTFLGLSSNSLFRIDPRISGNKLVDTQLKQYVSKNDFSATATTESGYIAVASNKGDIRLFDRLGINAKTHLPALGESIIGLDVSADGRWILATCKTYLLLVDALQHDGKNEGELGFKKSFPKDSKPKPRRLTLNPMHVAQMQNETKAPLSFTSAKFNTGLEANETAIITSTGPFMVTWNLRRVIQGRKDPYQIKRYAETVMADNFRFGSDKNVIVALPNQVELVQKQSFKKPTRESIATPVRQLRNRGNGIVDSPY
ncbi:Similar to Vacuolar import and degradation protein 27; acc. no. Q1MTR3 [Pyronema omphalodes CBS 100304]|uniref:Similar to Vacuolar import and degradation protein 27 acc. no. Q1MTR3 n=1 Tax=Pyronema omphalodes (strain CBS 100304) TaxID=1076935 RepID=U4L862_PYROM|nr:Similar to Vacuolar import and degradation protein 27; acc. no. Q1MTR3 [Pyronema omphalodes CBS 100304]